MSAARFPRHTATMLSRCAPKNQALKGMFLDPASGRNAADHKHRKGNDTAGGQRTEELHRVRNPGNPQAVNYQDSREQVKAPKKMARDKQERS